MLLQQTRVDQGLPYYERFVAAFPTVNSLAAAQEEEVLKLWQGLGYYSRARNLLHSARYIVLNLRGVFPSNSAAWKEIKGVGAYTAAAISSFAYDEVVPVLDGNVARVCARLLDCHEDVSRPAVRKLFLQYLNELIPAEAPALFNQAMMELGALVCRPGKPDCMSCPLVAHCRAFSTGAPEKLPVKPKKTGPVARYFHYLHIVAGENTMLRKRQSGDIWQGLHEFPLVEGSGPEISREQLLPTFVTKAYRGPITLAGVFVHRLTHQIIHAYFWKIYPNPKQILTQSGIFECAHQRVQDFALHRLMLRYLEQENTETES